MYAHSFLLLVRLHSLKSLSFGLGVFNNIVPAFWPRSDMHLMRCKLIEVPPELQYLAYLAWNNNSFGAFIHFLCGSFYVSSKLSLFKGVRLEGGFTSPLTVSDATTDFYQMLH